MSSGTLNDHLGARRARLDGSITCYGRTVQGDDLRDLWLLTMRLAYALDLPPHICTSNDPIEQLRESLAEIERRRPFQRVQKP